MLKKSGFVLVSGFLVLMAIISALFYHYKTQAAFPDQVKIGATYMTMNNDFYKYLNAEVEKTVNEHQDRLYTRDPALNIDKQVEQIDSFMKEKVNVIIINPVDGNSQKIISRLKAAKKSGIKIILVDSQLADSSFVDTTIVSDNYKAGVLCAQNLMASKKSADILLLEHLDAISATDRIQGFLDTIENHANYRVVARADALGQTEIAMPQVKNIIDKGIYFDTVMALNDRAALGSLAAIKGAKLSGHPLIYGIDGSPDMKNLIATTNDVKATVAQSPYTMGKEVIKATYQLSKDRDYDKEVIIPVELITKANIADYDLAGWQ